MVLSVSHSGLSAILFSSSFFRCSGFSFWTDNHSLLIFLMLGTVIRRSQYFVLACASTGVQHLSHGFRRCLLLFSSGQELLGAVRGVPVNPPLPLLPLQPRRAWLQPSVLTLAPPADQAAEARSNPWAPVGVPGVPGHHTEHRPCLLVGARDE